jgi:hypothetical protein
MTDVPLPLHIADREREPAPPRALPPSEANGVADGHEAPAGGSVTDELSSVAEGSAPLNGSALEGADAQPGPGPVQPDTSLGSPSGTPMVSDATRGIDLPALSLASESAPPPAVQPEPETFAAAPAEIADPPAGHVEPPAEIVMEVSPIFSALDAAEKSAAEDRQEPPLATEPMDYPFLLPPHPSLDDHQPTTPESVAAEPADTGPAATEPADDASPAGEQPFGDTAAAAEEEQPQQVELLQDAAAKIAEEANATAEALEGLKRLLSQKLPLLDPMPISPAASIAPQPIVRAAAPPSIPAYQLPAQPVTPPPMVPLAPPMDRAPLMARAPVRRRSGVPGFITGFALSGVFGAMLYVFLTLG